MEQPVKILGLDPAASTGFAFSSVKDRVEASGAWLITAARDNHPGQRLHRLEGELIRAVREWEPEVIAYELATFGSHNPAVKELHGELAGVIRLVAARFRIPVWGFPIGTWKMLAIGNGGADKPQVVKALKTLYGITARYEDEADAIGILLAAQQGPPPEPKRKVERRIRKARKREAKLF